MKNWVELVRDFAVAGSMARVATVSTLGIEKVGTSSIARRITNIVLVIVRTTKIKAHLTEWHVIVKKVDVIEKK